MGDVRKLNMTIFIVSNHVYFSDFMRGIQKVNMAIFIVYAQEVARGSMIIFDLNNIFCL